MGKIKRKEESESKNKKLPESAEDKEPDHKAEPKKKKKKVLSEASQDGCSRKIDKNKRNAGTDPKKKKLPQSAEDEQSDNEAETKKKKVLSEASQDGCCKQSDKNKGNAGTDSKKKKLQQYAEDEQQAHESEPNKNKVLSEVSQDEWSRKISKNKRNAGTDPKNKKLRQSAEDEQPVHESEPKKKKMTVGADASRDCEFSLASKRSKKPPAQMTEDDLTPEEVRVFERKLKKERKKEEKKVRRENHADDVKDAGAEKPSGAKLALRYLKSWSKKAQDWKFQKTRQTWLLLHMYDADQVPDKYFAFLLDYLEGLKGGARELTAQKAEALMKELEETEDQALLGKMDRARQVIQLLS